MLLFAKKNKNRDQNSISNQIPWLLVKISTKLQNLSNKRTTKSSKKKQTTVTYFLK